MIAILQHLFGFSTFRTVLIYSLIYLCIYILSGIFCLAAGIYTHSHLVDKMFLIDKFVLIGL